MANPLQRAAVRRKAIYIGAIVGLFTISLFWRGKLSMPFGNPARAADQAPSTTAAWADWAARLPVGQQASPERLDLRELDQGDPALATSVAQYSLVGFRGFVVATLWNAAIEKQKRNEWHEFELLANTVVELQPYFAAPWLFQAWNIAYNVSVENDKLGDMFFYIARGIELLAKGERRNTKFYKAPDEPDKPPYNIGKPEMRREIGFMYQNKFGVSDKVQTLRCLMQMAAMPPAERDPAALRTANGRVIPEAFLEFCKKNPQLVRRLRTQLGNERPEDVVQFLEDNYKVPTRFLPTGEKKRDGEDPFPIFPPQFELGQGEMHPDSDTDDTFDAFLAAKAWFKYAMATAPPPPKRDENGNVMPWSGPVKGEYDAVKYRMPRYPAYILFLQESARAQTYLAERLAKDGWFDAASEWNPDENAATNLWLKPSVAAPDVVLTTRANAQEEWRNSFNLWGLHARRNALIVDEATLKNYAKQAERVPGLGNLPEYSQFSAEQLRDPAFRRAVDARRAITYYSQNRLMTNFPFFYESCRAEQTNEMIAARKLLFRAETAKKQGRNPEAIAEYTAGLAAWRFALQKLPDFHYPERGYNTQEDYYETEITLSKLLKEQPEVLTARDQVIAAGSALASALPNAALAEVLADDLTPGIAEREVTIRVAALDPQVQDAARRMAAEQVDAAGVAAVAVAGPAASMPGPSAKADAVTAAARQLVQGEYSWLLKYRVKPFTDSLGNYQPAEKDYWIHPMAVTSVRAKLELDRPKAVPPPPPTGGVPPGPS